MFWPTELSEEVAALSVIPKLLETQDPFVAILSVPVNDLDNLFTIINNSRLPGNLFLKHLVVLADFGGEPLQRVNSQFTTLFPARELRFIWNGEERVYQFKQLPLPRLDNNRLGIGGKSLLQPQKLSELHQDIIALLIFGSSSTDEYTSEVLSLCEIGTYLGNPEELERFIKQRYIWVSRITGGARANALGQAAQRFVKQYIDDNLGLERVVIQSNGHLPNVSHTDPQSGRPTTFDLVVSRDDQYVAIEVSFQVTTNSTIERKAGQARSRFQQIEQAGHKVAYVIDGAGNFQREQAITTICSHSHCTVAFSSDEMEVLCSFLREQLAE